MSEDKKTDYNPISCSYYDELEALATKKEVCDIVYKLGMEHKEVQDIIVDFKIIDKVEYMILKENDKIRLDYIISVNGKHLWENRYC